MLHIVTVKKKSGSFFETRHRTWRKRAKSAAMRCYSGVIFWNIRLSRLSLTDWTSAANMAHIKHRAIIPATGMRPVWNLEASVWADPDSDQFFLVSASRRSPYAPVHKTTSSIETKAVIRRAVPRWQQQQQHTHNQPCHGDGFDNCMTLTFVLLVNACRGLAICVYQVCMVLIAQAIFLLERGHSDTQCHGRHWSP